MIRQSRFSVNYGTFISSVGGEIWSFRLESFFYETRFLNVMSCDKGKLKKMLAVDGFSSRDSTSQQLRQPVGDRIANPAFVYLPRLSSSFGPVFAATLKCQE